MAAITTTAARTVASLSKQPGRLALVKNLGWKEFDEDSDMQSSIHLDFLYDNLIFSAEKGFPWDHVCSVVSFAEELLQETKGKTLTEAVHLYKTKSEQLAPVLGEREFKIYTDFVFSTFMTHYSLFQFVFCNDRASQAPSLSLTVGTPFVPEVLKEAKEVTLWEYQQQYEEIQRKECERANERLLEKEKLMAEKTEEKEHRLQEVVKADEPLTKETVGDIIKDVLSAYAQATVANLKFNIQESQEDLEFKLEKTTLPRPQALGAPPRYNLKAKTPTPSTPVKGKKGTKAEEKREKSSGSGRSSRSLKS